MGKLYIVIPAYNEEENIHACINDWYHLVEKYNWRGESRLVIINDGSKDQTLAKLKELAKTRPYLLLLDKPNGGHGSTILLGYRFAIENKADVSAK